ncbi:aminotransferase class I/II-fold pyridoxal phosphate-dependent enzyme [Motilibacter aurantiacus]|uniref:aminotransferase class I/II-fold pyridoxal phosphate-dependent enzyme n=1 Tax=Motilibacter aurantiacus TaxID=2714955 RepID=UPI00140B4BEE|nr:aminotransferase class I/II-fold pyridoxal phosphate-dependent enzyme [Motilibacter aurantiacus]NHC44022.1 aminotransferase class I/II-fold pyridoxal phosphate-dependent enzyme [Motilibacter aurantiacus]
MANAEQVLQAVDDVISDGARRGMLHAVAEDTELDGRVITVDGQRLVSFGSCSYLGLEVHPALKAGVVDAVARFGTQFSSSRAYVSPPRYAEAEEMLTTLFGRPTVITPSTTMGHIATMPTVIGPDDALVLDHQVHNSVQTAAKLAQAQGTSVDLIPHNDLRTLERRLQEYSRSRRRVWYAADGLYSMYADFAPMAELNELVERHESLWLYIDDAHSVSWTGRHGRGHALEHLSSAAAERTVVAASLNKSFAAAGGALTFPTEEMRRRVFTVGGPLIFSGPVQPPMLGAILASAALHMSPEIVERQERLLHLIRLFNRRAAEEGLPLVSPSEAPIRCIGAGSPEVAYNLTKRLRDAGYFADTATFPAVAAKRSGARVTITANHTDEDVAGLVEALATALPAALHEEGGSLDVLQRSFKKQLEGREVRLRPLQAAPAAPGALALEHHTSVDAVDKAEWDAMFDGRGAFTWDGLRMLESVFADKDEPAVEHRWAFNYWVVRDGATKRPVAATFFTTALWKDDMLSDEHVSAAVERLRADDRYYLTSRVVGMGSLLTEGDHLYLDRGADWRSALRLILEAARAEEDLVDATSVVVRDIADGDEELHEFMVAEGFLRIPVMATWERDIDFADDEEFLAGLPKKARYHQRTQVLAWEGRYDVRAYAGGSAEAALVSAAELDHLYSLYRNVHARNLELNVFPLPRRVLDAVLATPGWELTVLRLVDGPDAPVAFGVQHHGGDHVAPLFVGLDYGYVASHRAYQQTLWQAIRSGRRRGARRILFGMSADLQKSRFGATGQQRWAYVQASETYNLDVLTRIQESLPSSLPVAA